MVVTVLNVIIIFDVLALFVPQEMETYEADAN